MCGIGAVHGKSEGKAETLRLMLSRIAHRGNSLYEMKEMGNCALGANRLEITGRNQGRQPKENEDGTVLAVFNGEIFNYRELNAELAAAGHGIKSECDTETLVHLYEQYGVKMVEKIDSEMFAFAIYDAKKDEVFAARDRWGVKPLYFAKDREGNVYFASEIKQLSRLPQIRSVKAFPPGHYFQGGKLTRYYKFKRKKARITERAAALRLRALVDEAVRKRVDTDLPIGVFLSGGLDSTAILATAVKYHKDVTAIIVGNKDSEDAAYAKRFCKDYGIKSVVLCPPSEEEIFANVEKIVYLAESFEPNVVRQSAISYFISKAAKDAGLRIVLCGEGADELFLGYPEFKELAENKIVARQDSFLKSLNRTQFQRVDRTSMGSAMGKDGIRADGTTVEVRVPFFDQKIVEFATSLPLSMMIREEGGVKVEKRILREAMRDRLPEYIRTRKKVVLSEGAGYGGNGPGGLFEGLAAARICEGELEKMQAEFPEWAIRTREEALYFRIFSSFGYAKAKFNKERVAANRTASTQAEAGKTVDARVLEAITGHEFCRFRPRKEAEIAKIVREKVRAGEQLEFFMLWGLWKKDALDNADYEALGILGALREKVRGIYPKGARITLVLTDTHAEINLLDRTAIRRYDSYAGLMQRHARSLGYEVVMLGELAGEMRQQDGAVREVENSGIWGGLLASAGKYYEGADKREGAEKYVARRIAEKPLLEAHFADAVFLTYNGPRYDAIAPDVPTLYIIPDRKRGAGKPWFSTA